MNQYKTARQHLAVLRRYLNELIDKCIRSRGISDAEALTYKAVWSSPILAVSECGAFLYDVDITCLDTRFLPLIIGDIPIEGAW